jgi:hypothetical protein
MTGLTSPSERFGYKTETTITLTDDEDDPTLLPTRDNIVNSLLHSYYILTVF